MKMETANRLLKADEVAQLLGIRRNRVYELSRNGEFRDFLVLIGANQYRYDPTGLSEYVARGGGRKSVSVSEPE